MSKHTPPPWNYRAGYVSTDVNGDYIVLAELHSGFGSDNFGDEPLMLGPKERSANGHLIAAAPEMLELIQALAVGYDEDDGQGIYQRIDDFIDFTHQAQSLLAKIEGGGNE